MAGRPRIYQTETLLDRAIEVFWKKGYEGASAQDLLKAMGIGQGSLYLTFKGGKRELFEKCLVRFSEKVMIKFNEEVSHANDPVEYLRQFFTALAGSPHEEKLKGCYLGNTLVELSNVDRDLRKVSASLLVKLEKTFAHIIVQAQQSGKIKNTESASVLALYLINLWNGINITRRLHPDSPLIRKMIEINLSVLK